jgi:uncharacterized protein (TIGR02145 family)
MLGLCKIIKKARVFIFLGLLTFLCTASFVDSSSFTTKQKESVLIAGDLWMSTNLNEITFRNGDSLLLAQSDNAWENAWRNEIPAYCYASNDSLDENIHGVLYNWFAFHDKRNLAPIGWHIATDEEWNKLNDSLGGWLACDKLKSKSGWPTNHYGSSNGADEFGFNALPVGGRGTKLMYINERAMWWGRSPKDSLKMAFRYISEYLSPLEPFESCDINHGLSVRCVKD